jgi:polysaccharide deacetylase family protein (PEP-CTERM system associated)
MAAANIISVDVEDYFQVEAFAGVVDRSSWSTFPCRVEANTRRLLDLFDEMRVKGTFFTLGWIAERYPGVVREIAARGHELACHSYWHRLIYKLTREEFRTDTLEARDRIEQAAGSAVFGYRAPSYSITKASLWALDVLAEAGFTYDSSIFPIRHDTYGIPDAPRRPFRLDTSSGPIDEFPISTFRFAAGPNFPVGGGGYLRIFPFPYNRFGFARLRKENLPLITYVHPWEVDPEQPRLQGRWKSKLRHYTNLGKTDSRLRALLGMGGFTSFRDSGLLGNIGPARLAASGVKER